MYFLSPFCLETSAGKRRAGSTRTWLPPTREPTELPPGVSTLGMALLHTREAGCRPTERVQRVGHMPLQD